MLVSIFTPSFSYHRGALTERFAWWGERHAGSIFATEIGAYLIGVGEWRLY